jgi:hypothetical protein
MWSSPSLSFGRTLRMTALLHILSKSTFREAGCIAAGDDVI